MQPSPLQMNVQYQTTYTRNIRLILSQTWDTLVRIRYGISKEIQRDISKYKSELQQDKYLSMRDPNNSQPSSMIYFTLIENCLTTYPTRESENIAQHFPFSVL